MQNQLLHILLVEDDAVDAEGVARAFRKMEVDHLFTVVRDGVEALALLRHEGTSAPQARPKIILLDLNMPRMNGIEFLHELRQDALLKRSIVFVLTTSNREADKVAAYDKQVAGYFLKSHTGESCSHLTALLELYRQAVELPPP